MRKIKDSNMSEKPKIIGHLVHDGDKYIAVWLVDAHKHAR